MIQIDASQTVDLTYFFDVSEWTEPTIRVASTFGINSIAIFGNDNEEKSASSNIDSKFKIQIESPAIATIVDNQL